MDSAEFHLAQANFARAIAPLDDPAMAGFVDQLEHINAVADRSPAFIWRPPFAFTFRSAFDPSGRPIRPGDVANRA